MAGLDGAVYEFGPFQLDAGNQLLRREGRPDPLELKPRLLDTLLLLVENPGRLMTKRELMERLWPDSFVQEASLTQHVYELRRIFGEADPGRRYIATVPRRGYRFVAEVRRAGAGRATLDEPSTAPRSLAVMPLDNLSADPEQEYFVDGMTDALITRLARIGSLRVVSRTSVMRYKGARRPLPEIARELGVDAIVEGSVLRAGDRVRIIAQLIDTASDTHLWSSEYEAETKDVLALQAEAASAIARRIRARVTPREQARIGARRAIDPAAHDAFLRGRHHFERMTIEDFLKAIGHLERALTLDPACAPALAALAESHTALAVFGAVAPREAYPKAKAAAVGAVALDAELAEAHLALANVHRDYDWDREAAEREYRRAVELSAGDAWTRDMYAIFLMLTGRPDEAERQSRCALELDPLHLDASNNLGFLQYVRGDYERAVGSYRITLDLEPGFLMSHRELALVLVRLGRFDEARREAESALALSRDSYTLALAGYVYGATGRPAQALAVLRDLEEGARDSYVPAPYFAYVHAGLGEQAEAVRWLGKGREERHVSFLYAMVDPAMESLRARPDFQALAQRLQAAGWSSGPRGRAAARGTPRLQRARGGMSPSSRRSRR